MFTVTGTLGSRVLSVSWTEGELDGDVAAIGRAEELVAAGATVWATPTGPRFTAALDEAGVALVTLVSVFDARGEILVAGDVPDVPGADLPDDAVG